MFAKKSKSYRLLSHDAISSWGIRTTGLLVLDSCSGRAPGGFLGRFLLRGEQVGDAVEHFGVKSDWQRFEWAEEDEEKC